jgi:hypothetical protein
LGLGVKVIIAHCAGLGDNQDLEDPQRKRVANFDLFLRLMDEKRCSKSPVQANCNVGALRKFLPRGTLIKGLELVL